MEFTLMLLSRMEFLIQSKGQFEFTASKLALALHPASIIGFKGFQQVCFAPQTLRKELYTSLPLDPDKNLNKQTLNSGTPWR